MRILFVAFSQSIHTVRWLRQIADLGWDIHLFPSKRNWWPICHPGLRNVTIHGPWSLPRPRDLDPSVRLRGFWPWPRGSGLAGRLLNQVSPSLVDPASQLCKLIRRLQPDLIHSLEIQNGGYLTAKAKQRLRHFPPWIVTNWGNDIYFFGRLREHKPLIASTLAACDYYSCECLRDVELGRQFGFQGEVLSVFPNTGGFDLDRIEAFRAPGPTSQRRLIVLKGYQNIFGRSLTGLRAIELCADVLKGYRIAIYSANEDVKMAAEILAHDHGLAFDILPFTTNHDDMLRLHGQARVSLGLNVSDGVSTSFLEALVMGSFPIQSHTAAPQEWIRDGETGSIVHPEDPQEVAVALRRALTDDALVDRADAINRGVARARLSFDAIRQQVIGLYQHVVEQGSRTSRDLHTSRRAARCEPAV